MPSLFPGMDPYLESQQYWLDFHQSFMTYWRDALADCLPDNYEVRLEEQISLVEANEEGVSHPQPDLTVSHFGSPSGPSAVATEAGATLTETEPVILHHPAYEKIWDSRIQILHRPGRALVTLLELLSPSNKRGDGYHQYRAKRNELFCHKKVHLIELDLLVGGKRLPMREPLPAGDFYAIISRGNRRPEAEVHAWTVRQPFPTIPIPLKQPDPDVRIALGTIFATVYQRGRYERSVDYNAPLKVPLPAEELAWAQDLARSRSRAS